MKYSVCTLCTHTHTHSNKPTHTHTQTRYAACTNIPWSMQLVVVHSFAMGVYFEKSTANHTHKKSNRAHTFRACVHAFIWCARALKHGFNSLAMMMSLCARSVSKIYNIVSQWHLVACVCVCVNYTYVCRLFNDLITSTVFGIVRYVVRL